MIKVFLNGSNGQMGQLIAKNIESYEDMQIVGRKDKSVFENKEPFDVLIDFSLPEGSKEAFQIAKQNKAAFLCGTTNLSHNFIEALKQEKEIPVFCAPNVSIGVFLFGRLLKEAVQKYQDYNFALHEEHHSKKKDAPSGTAKSLAALIDFPQEKITYTRKGQVPGTHSLTITSAAGDEEILLQHKALDRNLFASSAVKIARWLVNQKGGFYTMENFVK